VSARRPIRILHVLGMLERGGVETWLVHVLRSIDRGQFQMDFVVHVSEPQDYDEEVRALGSKVIVCPYPREPLRYARAFARILREHGPYDVVHSHVHHYSGYVLWLAYWAGVPLRIAHSHNDTTALETGASALRRSYVALTERLIHRYATVGLAASAQAATSLFGVGWEGDPRYRLLFCGVDFARFRQPVDRACVRASLHIPRDAFVIGNVGRLVEQKNHAFLIRIVAEVAKREQATYLLLVGEGTARPALEAQVAEAGLSDRVIFAGERPDVPRLMRGAMDVFVFPSRYEGLGLGLVEAQAAGLPCICSDVIPAEATIAPPLVRRLSLSRPAAAWADAVMATREATSDITPWDALGRAEGSPFNVQTSRLALERIYAGR
jgi:glycosyltransferase involved in cell wall biosynthesis